MVALLLYGGILLLVGYIAGNLFRLPVLRDLAEWLAVPADRRPRWCER